VASTRLDQENPKPLVIGLDLSLTGTGIADRHGATTTVKTKTADGDRRLLDITNAIRAAVQGAASPIGYDADGNPGPLIDEDRVHLAVIEDLPTHAKAAGITGMVHGVARAVLIELGVPYAVVPPATLKAFATGKGNGDKTGMAMAAYKRAGLEFGDDNQCDAWWLRMAGLEFLGCPAVDLPQAQRDRLAKAKWPAEVAA
jgi:hypothetical protein